MHWNSSISLPSACRLSTVAVEINELSIRKTWIVIAWIWLAATTTGYSEKLQLNQPSIISQSESTFRESSLFQLADPSSRFSLTQVRQLPKSQWQSVPAANFNIAGGSCWAYTTLYSFEKQTIWLELQTHFIDTLTVWLISSGSEVKQYPTTGFRQLIQASHNPLRHRYYLFEMPLEKSQLYQVYIRGYVVPGTTLKYAVRYWDTIYLVNLLQKNSWNWAVFVGTMLMAILFALINFFLHPRPIYLYYMGYAACMTLYPLVNDGWGIFFPAWMYEWINPVSIGIPLITGIWCLLMFSRHFLSISADNPYWWLRLHPGWYAILPLAFVALSQYGYWQHDVLLVQIGYQTNVFMGLLVAGLWVSYIVYALRKGFRPAWLLLLSQVIMLGFYAVNLFLVNTGFIRQAFPDMLVFRLALVTDLLIITFGLTYRQKIIRDSQQQLQADNARQREKILEEQSRRQEEEIKALRLASELQSQRERLARDLHDGIGSQLSHIISRLDLLAFSSEHQPQIQRLSDFTRETNQHLRETIWVLHQETITLPEFASRLHGILLKCWEDRNIPALCWQGPSPVDNPVLSPVVALHLLRITQEAVNNAFKYARATRIQVRLEMKSGQLCLFIADDGAGFDPSAFQSGYGLVNMRKRVEEIQGSFKLNTSASGTYLEITLPLEN